MSPVPQPEEERDRPNHDNSELEDNDFPDVIINVDSSDDEEEEEDEDNGYLGYQALSMNNDNDSDNEQEAEATEETTYNGADGQQTTNIHVPEGVIQQVRLQQFPDGSSVPNYMQVPDPPRPDKQDLLWNQPRTSDISLEMGQEEKIKSVMAGIKLPSCNIPDWARNLTDDQWQSQVVNKLRETSPVPEDRPCDATSDVTGSNTDCDKIHLDTQQNTGGLGTSLNSPD